MSELHLSRLDAEVKRIDPRCNVTDLFRHMRALYCESIEGADAAYISSVGTEMPNANDIDCKTRERFSSIAETGGLRWNDTDFHIMFRITNPDDLFAAFPEMPEDERSGIRRVVERGYEMSMLPMNAVLPEEVRSKYIPKADYFDWHTVWQNPKDPYGIFAEGVKVPGRDVPYLASRKFPHSALMPIHTFCPTGCVGCYRSYYTRERREEGNGLGITQNTVLKQTEEFIGWLNQNPDVYDIIISGGEPLMVNNENIREMFGLLKGAKNLKVARICTGALFQGLPFRIDNELLDNIYDFSNETGKTVTFNAHLSNHYQITPEALQAVRRIRKRGFTILSQVPIQEGVNFFRDDMEKTRGYLTELGRRQAAAGIQPYKMIVDVHPRTLRTYVPLEPLLGAWSEVYESHDNPEVAKPTSLSILCKDGNVVLSGALLGCMEKSVDKEAGSVAYRIPSVYRFGGGKPQVKKAFEYREPMIEGFNDDPDSLERLKGSI